MKKPKFSTLCQQAQEALQKCKDQVNEKIKKLQEVETNLSDENNMPKEFIASGMALRINESTTWVNVQDILKDDSGEALVAYLQDDRIIKPSPDRDQLVAAANNNRKFAHSCFVAGYKYEDKRLNQTTESTTDENARSEGNIGSLKVIVGDITKLNVDAIVNAANEHLLGGGGIDEAIHAAAGPGLLAECKTLHGCCVGKSKITNGYNLPAKYVIHTVGPNCCKPGQSQCRKELLESCYNTCLDIVERKGLKSIVFCCISTGIFGYPKEEAAKVAVSTIKKKTAEWFAVRGLHLLLQR